MTAPVCPWLAEPCISGTLATLACEVPARLTLLSKVVRFPNLPTSLPTNQPTYQPKPGRLTLPVKSFHRPLSTTTYKLLTHTLQTKLSTYHNSLWTTLTLLSPHRQCVALKHYELPSPVSLQFQLQLCVSAILHHHSFSKWHGIHLYIVIST